MTEKEKKALLDALMEVRVILDYDCGDFKGLAADAKMMISYNIKKLAALLEAGKEEKEIKPFTTIIDGKVETFFGSDGDTPEGAI